MKIMITKKYKLLKIRLGCTLSILALVSCNNSEGTEFVNEPCPLSVEPTESSLLAIKIKNDCCDTILYDKNLHIGFEGNSYATGFLRIFTAQGDTIRDDNGIDIGFVVVPSDVETLLPGDSLIEVINIANFFPSLSTGKYDVEFNCELSCDGERKWVKSNRVEYIVE